MLVAPTEPPALRKIGTVSMFKGALEEYQANLRKVLLGEIEVPAIAIGEG